jgi:hypothetical protein
MARKSPPAPGKAHSTTRACIGCLLCAGKQNAKLFSRRRPAVGSSRTVSRLWVT